MQKALPCTKGAPQTMHIVRVGSQCVCARHFPCSTSARMVRPWQTRSRSSLKVGEAQQPLAAAVKKEPDGPSTDAGVIYKRLTRLILPYWNAPETSTSARWKLAGVVALTLSTTAISVMFNFIGRDFFNALSEKNVDEFQVNLLRYLGAFIVGIPVFVFRSYFQSRLSLEWRQWMTEQLLADYLRDRTYYQLQADGTVDNPDQRLQSDVRSFTDSSLSLALTLLNAGVDLVSFSGILYSIYPPLFAALLLYSAGGTVGSVWLGRSLVGLNFNQEAREADLRYNLVRLRDNAEGIAFYRGEDSEAQLLKEDFFTSFYRYLIQLLPAAVVAPLFFAGKIEFGVINQSQSAFNHVLNDMSLVVYQFETLAGFSAVVDRLGEFQEEMARRSGGGSALTAGVLNSASSSVTLTINNTASSSNGSPSTSAIAASANGTSSSNLASSADAVLPDAALSNGSSDGSSDGSMASQWLDGISLVLGKENGAHMVAETGERVLLTMDHVTVVTPGRSTNVLVEDLSLQVLAGEPVLIMGPSGAGKTSVLRAAAGLWSDGAGTIRVLCDPEEVMFLPQKPYMVAGSLRDQVLYPRSAHGLSGGVHTPGSGNGSTSNGSTNGTAAQSRQGALLPSDEEVLAMLNKVRLGGLLTRYATGGLGAGGTPSPSESHAGSSSGASEATPVVGAAVLDAVVDWAASLSQGEQQRLAWARLLLAKPQLALLDEATSALDEATEAVLYQELQNSGITYVSVGHRAALRQYHRKLLQLSAWAEGDRPGVDWAVLPLAPPQPVLAS